MLIKSPTKQLPEASKSVKTTIPAQPVHDISVTIPPHATEHPVIQGPPPSIHGIEWMEQEANLVAVTKATQVIILNVNLQYACRYIYSLLVANASLATNYYIRCQVDF